jgi:SAM-dependent methyltransferase
MANKPFTGVVKCLKNGIYRIYERWFGLDTPTDNLSRNAFAYTTDMVGYAPSDWLTAKRLDKIIRFSPTDVFADFGSGKGKMVFLAARYPFKKVIGIEISRHLHDIAQKNIEHTRKTFACSQVELIHMDVLDYQIPDDLTIAYFFNPFVNEIFTGVINHIHESFIRTPRPMWIAYKNPIMRHHLDTCSWLKFKRLYHNIAFYRTHI